MDRQSVVDKMVREVSLEVRNNQGKIRELFFKFLVGVLVVENYIAIFAMSVDVYETRVGQRPICDI